MADECIQSTEGSVELRTRPIKDVTGERNKYVTFKEGTVSTRNEEPEDNN